MNSHLFRPAKASLTHGRGVWSGPFFADLDSKIDELYAAIRKKRSLSEFIAVCKNIHGYSEVVENEPMTDGSTNVAVWIDIGEEGHMGVIFPVPDNQRKITREICFFAKGPGQAAINSTAHGFSAIFATALHGPGKKR